MRDALYDTHFFSFNPSRSVTTCINVSTILSVRRFVQPHLHPYILNFTHSSWILCVCEVFSFEYALNEKWKIPSNMEIFWLDLRCVSYRFTIAATIHFLCEDRERSRQHSCTTSNSIHIYYGIIKLYQREVAPAADTCTQYAAESAMQMKRRKKNIS